MGHLVEPEARKAKWRAVPAPNRWFQPTCGFAPVIRPSSTQFFAPARAVTSVQRPGFSGAGARPTVVRPGILGFATSLLPQANAYRERDRTGDWQSRFAGRYRCNRQAGTDSSGRASSLPGWSFATRPDATR